MPGHVTEVSGEDARDRRAGGAYDGAALATAVLDEDERITAFSPGFERLLGRRAADVVGRCVHGLPARDADRDTLRSLLADDGSGAVLGLRHHDGRTVDVTLLTHLLPAEGHHTPGGEGGQRALLAAPLCSDRGTDPRIAAWAIDQGPLAGGLHDTDLRYLRVNREACELWGRPEAELVGRGPTDLLPTSAGREVAAAMRQALAAGAPVRIDSRLRMPGEDRPHAWAGYYTPVRDPEGTVRALHSMGIDITGEVLAHDRLVLLNKASERIGSTLDVRVTAEETARVVVPGLADFVTVDLLDTEITGPAPTAADGSLPLRRAGCWSVHEGCPESVLQPGDAEVYPASSPHVAAIVGDRSFITPLRSDPRFGPWVGGDGERLDRVASFGIHSAMAVPLRARGAILGVALFARHRRPEPFDAEDLLLAEDIAARAAVCVDNALRYAEQRGTALALQHSLLPHLLPRHSAVEVAGRYLPADSQAGVGGDWFDVIPLSASRVALVVEDVVGHGLEASAAMGRLRTAVRTLADLELPPDELLTHLDDLLAPLAPDAVSDRDLGATCLYAVYDPVTGRCTAARAGHPPPALVLPDGSVEFLDVPVGPPLGLGGTPFENVDVDLPEGSLLALYTDGLIESREQDVDEGMARLGEALERSAGSLEETCDALVRLLPGSPEDDVALLLARTRRSAPGSVATWELPAEPAVVGTARGLALRQLTTWGLDDIAFATEVIVTELATNAIRHAYGPVRLRLIHQSALTCEVSDGSSTYPHLRRARTLDEGGRGLFLVAQLSRRWGTRRTAHGKVIWAEQALGEGQGAVGGLPVVPGGPPTGPCRGTVRRGCRRTRTACPARSPRPPTSRPRA